MFNLEAALPHLLPKAIAWAEAHSARLAAVGLPLNDVGLAIARRVGVTAPERIRVLAVDTIPEPDDPLLRHAADVTGLLGPNTAGLTLGHGIYLRIGHTSPELVAHECRHVQQYEQAGSIPTFLAAYLHQLATVGYDFAPLELDARAHEQRGQAPA